MADPTADESAALPGDAGIVQEAMERWKSTQEFQGTEDQRSREDIKFANADPRNAWQWPQKTYQDRTGGNDDGSGLPCLTINTTRVHNDLIINQLSKNRYGIKIRPTGGKASYESAKMMQSIVRRIEDISKASSQYRKVAEQQVDGGIGYILLETRYVSNRSRNQDIYLRASRDPTGIYLDPWIREPDGSDANFGFVFDLRPRKEFNRQYPKWKDRVGSGGIKGMFADWLTDKSVMLVKYYRKRDKGDTYVWYKDDDGNEVEKLASEIKDDAGKELFKALIAEIKEGAREGGTRAVTNDQVEWFLIAGDTIIDKGDWAGKYIPICRCVGRELVIDQTLDRKGHTRPLIDAQRMLNWNASVAVQVVAYQTKTQWKAPARAVEGQESWKTGNIETVAVLLYNDVDDEADGDLQRIASPELVEPPKPSAAHEAGMQTAERQMMLISGQWQSENGQRDNQFPESGKALNERQQSGETATYHFPEHQSDMLRFIGTQLLDLIPKIYDTKRTLHIQDDAGDKQWITIDPDQTEVLKMLEEQKENEEAVKLAFNPTIGEYECVSDPGPSYETQRQEATAAMSQIMAANKEIAALCADLYFQYSDFPGAQEMKDRIQAELKAVKPYLFDKGAPTPQMAALVEQNKKLTSLASELQMKLADEKLKGRGRDEKRDIESYRADTDRTVGILKVQVEALSKLLLDENQRRDMEAQMEHELTSMGHQHIYDTIAQANEAMISQQQSDSQPDGAGQ